MRPWRPCGAVRVAEGLLHPANRRMIVVRNRQWGIPVESSGVERRLAAIMAADVVGYSRLMEADEAGTHARLKALRQELIEPAIARHKGRIVKLTGDGALVEFPSAVGAVLAAAQIQRAVAEHETARPADERIGFRIGINLGDVIIEGDDIYGDGVNVAARIEALCEPGGVWLSRGVYNQVRGKLDLELVPSGLHHVKNISEAVETFRMAFDGVVPALAASRLTGAGARATRWLPLAAVVLVAVVLLGGVWWFWPGEPPLSSRPGVAVLPFDNLGGDEDTQRLADGITEDIITDLARFRGLDVIARNSTAVYKNRPVDVRQVGKDLDVGYVLEGSIQRHGGQIRATAQLIDARTGAHVWSDRWDRPAQDVFAVQGEVAERVGAALGLPLGLGAVATSEIQRARRRPPNDLGAYEQYLLAAEAKARRTPESIREGMGHIERAITLDPGLARAYVLRGYLHFFTFTNGLTADFDAAMQAAETDFARAVALDPNDAEAHSALGFYYSQVGRFAESEAEIRASLALNPADGHVLGIAAATLPYLGYPDEAASYADKALRLDPNMATANLTSLKDAYYFARRFEDTVRVVARMPAEARSYGSLLLNATSLAMLGRPEDEVGRARAAMLARDPGLSVELLLNRDWLFVRQQERDLFVEGMRKAGFPACAKPEELANSAKPTRLPECLSS
jgi:TolB-like protein/class 3 adenylate cyclase